MWRSGALPNLLGAAGLKCHLDGLEDDGYVKPQRAVLHIVQLVLELFLGVLDGITVGVVDLGPAGDAGFYIEPHGIKGDDFLELVDKIAPLGPGAHEAHVVLEHVEELRQLVDARLADDPAHARNAGVVFGGPFGDARFRVLAHGAELDQLELPAVLAHPALEIKDRARRIEFDRQGGKQHDRRGKDNTEQG